MSRILESSFKDQFNYKFRRIKSSIKLNCEKVSVDSVSFLKKKPDLKFDLDDSDFDFKSSF